MSKTNPCQFSDAFARLRAVVAITLLGSSIVAADDGTEVAWKKHLVMDRGHCNTAVAIDANSDGLMDVVCSFGGTVSLFLAPNWNEVHVLHRFANRKQTCIHSTVIDVDGDGDLDWAGAVASEHPFWLENPGRSVNVTTSDDWKSGVKRGYDVDSFWQSRTIDPQITGIHCLTRSDIDNDGRDDLVINNFEPDRGIGDSIAWLSIPIDPATAPHWDRHVFADKDARGGSHYMGVGDIDGDGWKEIAVGAKGLPFTDGNWFAYWKNPGKDKVDGVWEKVILAEDQTAATNISPADVNGDGKVDWLASRGHGNGVIWFENPSWKIHTIDPEIEFPHSLTVADHDQDGDIDAAVCGFGSELLMWYENDGSGSFTHHTLDRNQQSYHLSSVDMDGDGDLDLLNAGRGTANVAWYENPNRPAK
ncbi:FG-GAP repeat domain-containing protein [Rubripirellula reticaptiva]|uniref:FG-GAP repeat protein n=1 Tax=Rubripirellula reticaptiva TaxID=2528013 RepID=A0A5C6FDH1_9BACT|nr:VCBS repeat-containing protein [Rubripirellula reticaptiva]TWU57641.1 FG-GAP repeat protein [Rubripirellula reticaptiva]